jgi:hypothetical protein
VPPPTIELVAGDAVAGEFPTNAARFVFVRSGDTNAALTIRYTVSGSATAGADYAALPGSVVLRAGATATNVFIVPVADSLAEGDETVTLTLQTSATYTNSSLTNASIVIHDRPLDAWRRAQFTSLELADATISGDLADPDQDGLANLMEHALGSNPKVASPNALWPRIENEHLTFTFTRAKAATDVALALDQSSDLQTWQNDPALFDELSVVDEGALQRITVCLAAPAAAASASFLRLRVMRL